MNKVLVQGLQGSPQDGITVHYIVVSPDKEPLSAGSMMVSLSHPEKSKEIIEGCATMVREILEAQGYIDKPNIKVVTP